jgi:RNA polymerase sigma factor (sigma-70 family)
MPGRLSNFRQVVSAVRPTTSDRALVAAYARDGDEAALNELIRRHSATVRSAALDVAPQAAEDVSQAVFLLFGRKAASLAQRESVAGWFFQTARHLAMKARTAATRCARHEGQVSPAEAPPDPLAELSFREVRAAVAEELARLPEALRAPLLLTYWEGTTNEAAAHRLGCSVSTLKRRLEQGRDRMATRLARRGFTGSAVLAVLTAIEAGSRASAHPIRGGPPTPLAAELVRTAGSATRVGLAAACAAIAVGVGLSIGMVSGAGEQQAPAKAKEPPLEPRSAEAPTLQDGFELPAGAVHRFGNLQLRHPDGIYGAVVSPDGKLLATQGTTWVVVWDLETLQARRRFLRRVHPTLRTDEYNCGICFLGDSQSLALVEYPNLSSPSREVIAHVWDIATGSKKFTMKMPRPGQTWAHSLCLASDGKEIALLDGPTARFFDAKDGRRVRDVNLPSGHYHSLATVPRANRVFALTLKEVKTGSGWSHKVLDVRTGQELFSLPPPDGAQMTHGSLSSDGKLLAYQQGYGKIRVQDIDARQELLLIDPPDKECHGPMQLIDGGKTLIFSGLKGELYRWDLKANRRGPDVGRHPSAYPTHFAVSPDETMLYSIGMDCLIRRWDLKTNKALSDPDGYTRQTAVALAADGKHLFIADHAGRLDSYDLETRKLVKRLQLSGPGINCLAVSPDGKWLAAGRTEADVQLWNLATGQVERIIQLVGKRKREGRDLVEQVAFRPDSRVLYTTSHQTSLTAWQVLSGNQAWHVDGYRADVAFDPKGKWIACIKPEEESPDLTILDAATGAVHRAWDIEPTVEEKKQDRDTFAHHMVFVPDGSRLVTTHFTHFGSWLREWEPSTGQEAGAFTPQGWTTPRLGEGGLVYSADGKWLASAGNDRKINLFEVATARHVHLVGEHLSHVHSLAFTRDGRYLVGNAALAPILWDLAPPDLPKLSNLDATWEGLSSDDGAKAYRLLWALIRNPGAAVTLFRERLNTAVISPEQFQKWLADLDGPRFIVRETAERDLLLARGKLPADWLKKALEETKSEEVKVRLRRVAQQWQKPDPNEWRMSRAVAVLERIATPEAKELLRTWANMGAGPLADEAKQALERLALRDG